MIRLDITPAGRVATVNIPHGSAVYSRAIVFDQDTRQTLRAPWCAVHRGQLTIGRVHVPGDVLAQFDALQNRAYDMAEGVAP